MTELTPPTREEGLEKKKIPIVRDRYPYSPNISSTKIPVFNDFNDTLLQVMNGSSGVDDLKASMRNITTKFEDLEHHYTEHGLYGIYTALLEIMDRWEPMVSYVKSLPNELGTRHIKQLQQLQSIYRDTKEAIIICCYIHKIPQERLKAGWKRGDPMPGYDPSKWPTRAQDDKFYTDGLKRTYDKEPPVKLRGKQEAYSEDVVSKALDEVEQEIENGKKHRNPRRSGKDRVPKITGQPKAEGKGKNPKEWAKSRTNQSVAAKTVGKSVEGDNIPPGSMTGDMVLKKIMADERQEREREAEERSSR